MEKEKTETRKRGLGRGLSALFEDDEDKFESQHTPPAAAAVQSENGPRRTIGIDQLEPGKFQPRQHMDPAHLKELSESIAVHGVLQPILVRQTADSNRFEIIAGERRWRAAQQARLHEVPIIIKALTDVQALEIALIENLQRADLDPMDEAYGYQRLMDEFGHTQEKLAAALGKSRSHIANTLRLMSLPTGVQQLLREGKLSAGHARALVTAANPEVLARAVVERGLSVRDTEKLAAGTAGGHGKKAGAKKSAGKDVDTLALEHEISQALGLKVIIDMKKDGRAGSLSIDFKSLDQLDDVLKRLSQNPLR